MHPINPVPASLGSDALGIILALALQRAGLPAPVVVLVQQMGQAAARELIALLEAHESGVEIERFRAELPDLAAALDKIERGDG